MVGLKDFDTETELRIKYFLKDFIPGTLIKQKDMNLGDYTLLCHRYDKKVIEEFMSHREELLDNHHYFIYINQYGQYINFLLNKQMFIKNVLENMDEVLGWS